MLDNNTEKPALLVDLKKYRIRIHKQTLLAIGNPTYILLLVNPEERTLAVICSDRTDPRAHHMTASSIAHKKSFELYSRSLVNSLRDVCSNWLDNQSYRLYGKIIPNEGIVRFHMSEAILVPKSEG